MILDTIIIQPGIDSIMALRERERERERERLLVLTLTKHMCGGRPFIIRQAVKLWLVKVACLYYKRVFEIIFLY